MFTRLWLLFRNQTIRSDGRSWPWPERHYQRKLVKWLYQVRKRMVREVEIADGESRFRFRCENFTELARCMKMFIKEPGSIEWIKAWVEPGDVFYDIGANIGVYTVLAAQRVGASGKVFAFEPHSATFPRLLETIAINSLSEVVTPCNIALHERQGFFPFCYSSPEAGSSQSQLMPQHLHRRDRNPSDVVELKFSASLDSLIAAGGFASADHVKIDVDGNELMILRGMSALLSGRRPPKSIQVEINQDQRAAILNFMQSHGYLPAQEHQTRKGTELIEEGADSEDHAYNIIFRPKARSVAGPKSGVDAHGAGS
jgi:FkbM family methyltransferase